MNCFKCQYVFHIVNPTMTPCLDLIVLLWSYFIDPIKNLWKNSSNKIILFLHWELQFNFFSKCNWKKFDQFAPAKNIALCENDTIKKTIIKRCIFKNKANNSSKPVDKTAFKKEIDLVVKLNKITKKTFLEKSFNRKYYR